MAKPSTEWEVKFLQKVQTSDERIWSLFKVLDLAEDWNSTSKPTALLNLMFSQFVSNERNDLNEYRHEMRDFVDLLVWLNKMSDAFDILESETGFLDAKYPNPKKQETNE